jgi:hypothetical protein
MGTANQNSNTVTAAKAATKRQPSRWMGAKEDVMLSMIVMGAI